MAEKLEVKITADNTDLKRKLNSSTAAVKKAAKGLMIAGAVALAAGTAIAVMAEKTAHAGDNFNKMSLRTGISVENLSRLDFAAQRSGSNLTTVEAAIRYMTKAMSDSTQGLATAARGFDMLGVSITDEHGNLRNSIDVMKDVSGALSGMTNKTEQIAAAQYVFGSRYGTQLLPMLISGKKGLQDLMDVSDALGNTWSTKDAQAAADFEDRLTDIKSTMDGLKRSFLIKTFPFFEAAMLGAEGVIQSMNDIQQALVDTGGTEEDLASNTLDTFQFIATILPNFEFSFNETISHIKLFWANSFGKMGAYADTVLDWISSGGQVDFAKQFEENYSALSGLADRARGEINQSWDEWAMKQEKIKKIWADLKTQLSKTTALDDYNSAIDDLGTNTGDTADSVDKLKNALQGLKTLTIQGVSGNQLMGFIGNLQPTEQTVSHTVNIQLQWNGQKIKIDPNSLNTADFERKIGRSVIQQIIGGRDLAFGGG